jgi:hypothetical protein
VLCRLFNKPKLTSARIMGCKQGCQRSDGRVFHVPSHPITALHPTQPILYDLTMDDDDADYMQGSDDEVCPYVALPPLYILTIIDRTTASTTQMETRLTNRAALMSRICIIPLNVYPAFLLPSYRNMILILILPKHQQKKKTTLKKPSKNSAQ